MQKKYLALSLLVLMAMLHAAPARAQQIYGQPLAMGQTTTGESSHVLKATGGYVYSLNVTTSAAGFAMLYDAAAVPSNGAVTPKGCFAVAANSSLPLQFNYPFPFGTGIVVAFSSTGCLTQTLANAFFSWQVQ